MYIQNLPTEGFTVSDLKNLFSPYGQITSHSINADKPSSGFVSFATHEEAKHALDEGNKFKIMVNNNAVIVMAHVYKKDNELQKGSSKPIVSN